MLPTDKHHFPFALVKFNLVRTAQAFQIRLDRLLLRWSIKNFFYSMIQRGDGFTIENGVIKGEEKYYDVNTHHIGELIFNSLSEKPEHIGQIDAITGKSKTFHEIKEQSIRLAAWMREESIGAGDIVALCSPRYPDVDSIFYATLFIGATYTPFIHNGDLTAARHYINILRPRMIFTHKNNINTLQEAAALENHSWKIILFDSDCDYTSFYDILKIPSSDEISNFEVTKVNTETMCVILGTSGTTGTPKFIPLSYKNFTRRALSFDINDKSKNSNHLLLTYCYPGWEVQLLLSIRSIFVRQTQVFHKAFETHETCKIIEKYKINILVWDVYMILQLSNSDVINKYDLKSVKYIHSVGSKLFEEVRGKLLKNCPNVQYIGRGLGIIETCLVTLFTEKCRNPQSEGTVVPNVQIKMIDVDTGLTLGHDEVGELCTKSPYLLTGYYKNPTATKLVVDDEGWFHTGDEAYYDENGEIVVVGRLKEIIKYRKTEIYPLCVEQTLLSHPSIIDAAVVGIPHDIYVEQPVAFVTIDRGSKVTEEDVLKLTTELEYSDVFKDKVIFFDGIPRTNNGKINRRILIEHAKKLFKSH